MKQAIRQNLREKRKQISPNLYAEKSRAIGEKLQEMDEWRNANSILAYVSTKEEVDTHAIIDAALQQGKKVFVPRVNEDHMVICPIVGWQQLKPGNFGILEPCTSISPSHPGEIDLILVPGIAFDPRGHRIGYGRGFYDGFLTLTRGLKIGLAFSEQIVDEIPEEEHDVPLDLVITDKLIIHP